MILYVLHRYSYNPVPVRQAALSVSQATARVGEASGVYRNNIAVTLEAERNPGTIPGHVPNGHGRRRLRGDASRVYVSF